MAGTVGSLDNEEKPPVRVFDQPKGQPAIETGGVAFVRFGSDGMQNRGIGAAVAEVVMALDQQGDSAHRYRRCVAVNIVGSIRAERKTTCP